MRIGVATENEAKLQGVAEAAALLFPGARVVRIPPPELPRGLPRNGEVLAGARARAQRALEEGCEIGVGVESGLVRFPGAPSSLLLTLVLVNDGEKEGWATSAAFPLPTELASGDLGRITGPGGAVARFSRGHIRRKELVKEAALLALSQLL